MFGELRKEGSFCDVNFLCKGTVLRGHRVVLSGWSRWLRSLLADSPLDGVVSMDIFDASALAAVMDYMYGVPLLVDVPVSRLLINIKIFICLCAFILLYY